jgi:hypothetical protein
MDRGKLSRWQGAALMPRRLRSISQRLINSRPDIAHHKTRADKKAHARRIRTTEIAKIESGCDLWILSRGEVSLADLFDVLLHQTGPAEVAIVTWTIGRREAREVIGWADTGRIKSVKIVLDDSYSSRQPVGWAALRGRFGDNLVTVRNHAKLLLIENDSWAVNVMTSANLNTNKRQEYFLVRDDPDLAAFNRSWVEELFR